MKFTFLPILAVSSTVGASAFAATCAEQNPEGPRAVIECFAKSLETPMSAVDFWNTKLFSSATRDKFCVNPVTFIPVVQKAQREMYEIACGSQKGTYFDFENFASADEVLKAKLGAKYQFMRLGTFAVKIQELSNLLATAAQETTGGAWPNPYETDGFFYRYENGPLQSADPAYMNPTMGSCYVYAANPNYSGLNARTPADNCRTLGLDGFYTEYYPLSAYAVAIKDGSNSKVNTSVVMYEDQKYDTATNVITKAGKPTLYPGGTFAPPAGYTWQYMNAIIQPGYWVGMGNLQLTGDSMVKFFGWYYQNIASPTQSDADYQAFVKQFLTDGKLAWMGGLWFWNYRIAGQGFTSLNSVLAGSTKDACHDIGITTYMLNGGCNDSPERVKYYNHFKSNVFKQPGTAQSATYNGVSVSSYACSPELYAYCTK